MSRCPSTGRPAGPQTPGDGVSCDLDLDSREMKVMAGRLDDLPQLNSKLVRIFTSSTFTDTQVERNELMEHVYPRIKDFCRQKYALEFQVVDMRWGVTDEATDDHMTVDVCLNEIRACQKVSVGPNFVLFLGMKYGYRPVPRVIPVEEFSLIQDVISTNRLHREILSQWYILDSNAQPPVFLLQPISTHLPYFNQKNLKTLQDRDQSIWWDTLSKLQKMFREAVNVLHKKGKLSSEQLHNYFMSVTEREVTRGILQADDPSKHCLVYFRQISDIGEVPPDKSRNFIDIAYNKPDTEPQALLSKLRGQLQDRIPGSITPENFQEYDLKWRGSSGIDPTNDEDHKSYLKGFCEHFESSILRLIDESMATQRQRSQNAQFLEAYNECLQHLHACNSFCKVFQGRDDILVRIKDYLRNSSNVPLVLYGQSGCGKTSIMAKAYSQVLKAMSDVSEPVTVIRFLGTSPNSSVVVLLLRSICQQIAINYQRTQDDIPTELSLLVQHFKKLLALATDEKPLVIFLDSIDQLSTVYEARKLTWVPSVLPPHVKIVLSTLPRCKDDNILKTFLKKLPGSEEFVEVRNLGEVLSKDILTSWLKDVSRTVTDTQQQEINRVLQECSLPLFLRLVFDQICSWRSFDVPEVTQLSMTIHDSIDRLFDRLECRYGRVFVSNTFTYITISRNGFSETELEDILSLDDDVLNAVYQYHRPPVRRIPPLLWTRLKGEIPNYLTEREADGITVINWYHRQFFEVAKTRYLQNMNIVKKMHNLLSDYFLGTWAGIPKPFRYTEDQKKMFFLSPDEMNGQADRLVPEQPLVFMNDGKVCSFNLRKLNQLPYHLVKAERLRDLDETILLNFKWLHKKLEAQPLQATLGDYKYVLSKHYDPEIKVIWDSLRLSGSILTRYPDMLGIQLVGRLMPYYSSHSKIRQLINSCDKDGVLRNALIPAYHCLHTPGGPLQYSLIGHPGTPFGIVVTSDQKYLISVSRLCIIWDIDIGDVWRQVEPKIRGIMQGLCLSPDDQHAVCFTNPANQVVIITVMTGEVQLLDNPFDASSKVRGVRCNNAEILVWVSSSWCLVDYLGAVIARGDFESEGYNILDMMMTDKSDKPIVKLQVSDGRTGPESSCVFRMTSNEVEDFRFSTSVILNRSRDVLYACSVQHTAPTNQNSRPGSRYSIVSRFSVVVTQYTRKGRQWVENNVMGDTAYTIYSLSLSSDDTLLIAAIEIGFIVWKTSLETEGELERTDLNLPLGKKNFPGSRGLCVFSRNNEYLMAGSRKTVFVYDLRKNELIREITAHFDRILDMVPVITQDTNIAITSSSDHSIKIWNFDNIRHAVPVIHQHEKEVESIAIACNADLAVCVTRDVVGLWNTSKGTLLNSFHPAHSHDSQIARKNSDVIKVTHAAITADGRFVISADSQKLTFWESESGDLLHSHMLPTTDDGQLLNVTQITLDNAKVIIMVRRKPTSRHDVLRPGMGIVFVEVTWEYLYDFHFVSQMECPAAVTSNSLYIAVPTFSAKLHSDCLSIWHTNTGTYLYDITLKHLENGAFFNLVPLKHEPSLMVVVTPTISSVVEINKKLWKKGEFVLKNVPRWNGRCTSDGVLAVRKSPDSKSLEIFNVDSGKTLKTLFSGKHPGDTEGEVFITKNDKHVVYYQQRRQQIRVFRMSLDPDAESQIAVLQPDARVCGLLDCNGGTDLVVGLSDGRLMTFVIADPLLPENQKRLRELREKLGEEVGKLPSNGLRKPSSKKKWVKPLNVARLAAKAKVATTSKLCTLS